MFYGISADIVVICHLIFILFVAGGGFLNLQSERWSLFHLPSVLWAAAAEFRGWYCPLTPLENWLRLKGGGEAYHSDFIQHYLLPVIYPASLSKNVQVALGISVIGINIAVYLFACQKVRGKGNSGRSHIERGRPD